jgi:hypothetical protein
MKQGSPLLAPFKILAVDTFAVIWTENVCLEALTVLLQAPWLLTMTPLVVFTYQWLLSNILPQISKTRTTEYFWSESIGITFQSGFNSFLSDRFILHVVAAVYTVATFTISAWSKTLTV